MVGLIMIYDRQGRMESRLAVLESRLAAAAVTLPSTNTVAIGPEWPKHVADDFSPQL